MEAVILVRVTFPRERLFSSRYGGYRPLSLYLHCNPCLRCVAYSELEPSGGEHLSIKLPGRLLVTFPGRGEARLYCLFMALPPRRLLLGKGAIHSGARRKIKDQEP